MVKHFLLTVAYDGTDFHGWQRQVGQSTVQQSLEEALSRLTGDTVSVIASGRTDEGVHAAAQAVSFACETSVPAERIPAALAPLLPPSVRPLACRETAADFNARTAAKRKTYVYRLYVSPVPLVHIDRYALRVETPPRPDVWRRACARIAGTHDFRAFRCLGSSAKTTVRTVYACDFDAYPAAGTMPPVCEFRITGDGFLYKTVRLLVGALMRLDGGEITEEAFARALDGEEDAVRKVPAPSKGLTLWDVSYDA